MGETECWNHWGLCLFLLWPSEESSVEGKQQPAVLLPTAWQADWCSKKAFPCVRAPVQRIFSSHFSIRLLLDLFFVTADFESVSWAGVHCNVKQETRLEGSPAFKDTTDIWQWRTAQCAFGVLAIFPLQSGETHDRGKGWHHWQRKIQA